MPANTTSNFSYDNIYQLTQVTQGAATPEAYTYDAVGNRLTSAGSISYNYNSSNHLTSSTGVTYAYDNNGNTTGKTDSNGTTSYTWDYENRLTSVTLPNSGGTVSFTYDPLGHRVRKVFGGTTTIYAYDGENILEETDASGTVVARYAQGLNIDEPLAMLRSSATHYYGADGLGSITSLTDSAGSVATSYTYDSFGNLTASTGSVVNPFRYTAREWDSETADYFYRARYYDPAMGRFMSEDPVGHSAGVNFYTYVEQDPVNFRDPSGLRKIHGNWCGPNWTGGAKEEFSPAHASTYEKPIDGVDASCMQHDMCYFKCRDDYPCSTTRRARCMRKCDKVLVNTVPRSTAMGHIVMSGISWKPDIPGTDESCGCKEPLWPLDWLKIESVKAPRWGRVMITVKE